VYIIKNPTNTATTISQYQDQTGTSSTSIPLESIIWLQSDGIEWQLINNLQASSPPAGGGSSGTNGNGTNGTATNNLVSYWLQDGSNQYANFEFQIKNEGGTPLNYEALLENVPYATIPGLNLVEHTYQVIDNGNGSYNHIFTSTSAINPQETVTIYGGPNTTPAGSGIACNCTKFYIL